MSRTVALLSHPRSEEAKRLSGRISRVLAAGGVAVEPVRRERGVDGQLPPGSELVVAVGGDGTVIRAQRLAIAHELPVLGVGAGRLGFLAELTPEELDDALGRVIGGEYTVEHRGMLDVVLYRRDGASERHVALNDTVLARGRRPSSLWFSVAVDDTHLANYVADGVIAATATGSTAYSLAAGGPILAPELRDIVITPIAAHLSVVQSIILPAATRIELRLLRSHDASIAIDGQVDRTVALGDRLVVTASERTARFVRLTPPGQFYTELVARLQHNLDRLRGPSGTDHAAPRT